MIKALILEFMASNGTSHIKEIHLQVVAFRPEVPQHTVRPGSPRWPGATTLKRSPAFSAMGSRGSTRRTNTYAAWFRIMTGDLRVIRDTGETARFT